MDERRWKKSLKNRRVGEKCSSVRLGNIAERATEAGMSLSGWREVTGEAFILACGQQGRWPSESGVRVVQQRGKKLIIFLLFLGITAELLEKA